MEVWAIGRNEKNAVVGSDHASAFQCVKDRRLSPKCSSKPVPVVQSNQDLRVGDGVGLSQHLAILNS